MLRLRHPRLTPLGLASLLLVGLSCHKSTSGSDPGGESPPPGPPLASVGSARFLDSNDNGLADAGDQVLMAFNVPLAVNDPSVEVLELPIRPNTFGVGAALSVGPEPNELCITLGKKPQLRSRGVDLDAVYNHRASRIGGSGIVPQDAVENSDTGRDLEDFADVDLIPVPFPTDDDSIGTALHAVSTDLNLDGRPDLVVTDDLDGLGLYRSMPKGDFSHKPFACPGALRVVTGDLDRSGTPDLVILAAHAVTIAHNHSQQAGPIQVALVQTIALPGPAEGLALIDFDRDGDLDVAVAAEAGVLVLFNEDGLLNEEAQLLPGSLMAGAAIHTGDLDLDGDLDLFVASPGGTLSQAILLGPCEAFETLDLLDSADSRHVAMVDLDRDGLLDFVLGGEGSGVRIWCSTGILSYEQVEGVDSITGNVRGLGITDIDEDGLPDLFWIDGESLHTAFGDGRGLMLDAGHALEAGTVHGLALADFDVDGDTDVFGASAIQSRIWHSSSSGTWGRMRYRGVQSNVGYGPVHAIASADLDGDQLPEVALALDDRIVIPRNHGGGQFGLTTVIDLGQGRATSLCFADLDGDRDQDLVIALTGTGQNIYLNDGTGKLTPHGPALPRDERSLAVADFDGDQLPDLIFGTGSLGPDVLLLNLGSDCTQPGGPLWAGFAPPQVVSDGYTTTDIAAGDLDLDGDLDLVMAHSNQARDVVLLNDGSGQFTESGVEFPATPTHSVSLGDADLDGDLDLNACGHTGNYLYHNDGSGHFQVAITLDVHATLQSELVHLNGDDIPDLLVVNVLDHGFEIWPGTLDGRFSAGRQWRQRFDAIQCIHGFDADVNGTVDFLAGTNDGDANQLWLNL